MAQERFTQIEQRNATDKIKMCYELYVDSFKSIEYNIFSELFQNWLQFFGGGDIDDCIAYFKKNKIK